MPILESFQDFLIKLDMKPRMQTYQNYEQRRHKLGTFLKIKYFKNQKFQKHFFLKLVS